MLKELTLKNYALAKDLSIEFKPGLNIFTGESGAGKSVIIGSFELLLGNRATTDQIRFGQNKALIEAQFDIRNHPNVNVLLKHHDFDVFDDLILRREISQSGQNRIFINDTPTTKSVLTQITKDLIDIHGQHDHQHLLHEADHLHFIDIMIPEQENVKKFKRLYRQLNDALKSYYRLLEERSALEEQLKKASDSFNEIQDAHLSEDEEDELKSEEKRLNNAEDIGRSAQLGDVIINDDNQSLFTLIRRLEKELGFLADFDQDYQNFIEDVDQFKEKLSDISFQLQKTQNQIYPDPEKLSSIQERLFSIEKLKRKYGNSIQEILEFQKELDNQLRAAHGNDQKINDIESKIKTTIQDLNQIGAVLSQQRHETATMIETKIKDHFNRLGMEHAELQVEFKSVKSTLTFKNEQVPFTENGFETLVFNVKTNKGSPWMPVSKTASGGELSRIMLALKSILAEKDHVGLLVFDEIDTGISGQTASRVGQSIQDLSEFHQLICITHSPQIASKGATHFKVEKNDTEEETFTLVNELNEIERVMEIASLISSGNITDNSMTMAKELLAIQ